jgi:hypothetical protein
MIRIFYIIAKKKRFLIARGGKRFKRKGGIVCLLFFLGAPGRAHLQGSERLL